MIPERRVQLRAIAGVARLVFAWKRDVAVYAGDGCHLDGLDVFCLVRLEWLSV